MPGISKLKRWGRRGQLTYLGPAPTPKFLRDPPRTFAWFHCACGEVKRMRKIAVATGRSTSCGCQQRSRIRGMQLASVREAEAKRRAAGVR